MPSRKAVVRSAVRNAIPAALLATMVGRRRPAVRVAAGAALVSYWSEIYRRYRAQGLAQTRREFELMATATWEAYTRHYNERVPTIEEEFDIWGEYHQHRHEMRYDLVADAVRSHVPAGGTILDIGCGSALVADRIGDLDAHYIGLDFPHHHINYARRRLVERRSVLRSSFVRGAGEGLPVRSDSVDVVVMSEVIEHLVQPELAVWELARVMRPGGYFVMTTNNAGEVPLRSPLSHLFAWLEKSLGVYRPDLISLRPWIWPWPVDRELLGADDPDVYLPHTHHIYAETREMFSAAGLDPVSFSTFEFPPPQAELANFLDARGEWGRRAVDVIENVCQRLPLVNRLGCHIFVVSRKARSPVADTPPPGIWPGPFSNGGSQISPSLVAAGSAT